MPNQLPFSLSFPLQGSQLIEASAGTGKTFTIATLYLRLVLGHGSLQTRFIRALLPPEILVMTFTEAATQELRDRIRTRLTEAARYFRDELSSPDEMLTSLRNDYLEMEWPNCAQRLEIAAQWMDEAAVSTIHSWCQRMLKEHAFDSGNLFQQHLETDHSELLASVVRDYWRIFCYPLQGRALEWVITNWQTPQLLTLQVKDLLSAKLVCSDATLANILEQQLTVRQQQLATLKEPWLTWADELEQLCDEVCAKKLVDSRKLQKRFYNNWFTKLRIWANSPTQEALDLATGFDRLTEQGLAEIWKQGTPPTHPALQAMASLPEQLNKLVSPNLAALTHATQWVKQQVNYQKIRRAEIGFDDLLTRLDEALHKPMGERLAKLIRQQFPVAMVDEFQDTDPIQYRILHKIYLEHPQNCGLFLIGDPKQAIYAFRGADIYTYLQARQQMGNRLHQLDTNYRSSQAMVTATNNLFNYAEQHNTKGAFLFKTNQTNPLPFYPVKAQGTPQSFTVNGQSQSALTFWYLPSQIPISTNEYYSLFAASCASEIVKLLNLGQQNKAGFWQEDYLKPLRPSDIAILVRNGNEAKAIKAALAQRKVRSVYLSDKDSVLDTQEAEDLLTWLEACAQPDNESLLRAALATTTLDLTLQELDSYNQHENIWEQRILQFRYYKDLWRKQGILPMLRRFLQDFNLPPKLLSHYHEGERKLTNLLHLAELLQQAAAELDGEQALIRYLAERLNELQQQTDETIVRLESDDQLVKIITIHKSKGLEYPLVFLPFICSFRAIDGRFIPIRYHDNAGNVQLSLEATSAIVQQADSERLAEDLRLLYVALTRAKYNCWLGIADLKQGNNKASLLHKSAIGYLLNNNLPLVESTQLVNILHLHTANCASMQSEQLPAASLQQFMEITSNSSAPQARQMTRQVFRFWWISSYSSLRLTTAPLEQTALLTEALLDNNPHLHNLIDDDNSIEPEIKQISQDIHGFPRGPIAGNFLHSLLDWVASQGFATILQHPEDLRDMIARRCNIRGWEHWIEVLYQWIVALLNLKLPILQRQLAFTDLINYSSELEFMFASHWVNIEKIDSLISQYILPNAVRPPLDKGMLNGMFKGFIDLIFEHKGRYYLIDYKSNWLGENNAAYTNEAMQTAMLDHRYDLQLVFYQLALHRQLKARLTNYNYQQHTGEVMYLFLRGYQTATQGIFYQKVPFELIDQLDQLFSHAKAKELA